MRRTEGPSPLPIRAIEALLVARIGLDPSSVSPNLVARGVRTRMAALGLDDVGAYEARLRETSVEAQELIEEIVIPESWFFRDGRPFRSLQDHARGRLAAWPRRRPVRILSLPCARGEEPLSIAMTLRDAEIDLSRVRIDGADVSARNLDFARRGLYSANAFRGGDLGFRDRYFHPRGTGFQVAPSILGAVRWIQANILEPDILAGEPPYDVVFCRNLLIYFTPDARARTLKALDRLLAEDGLLFVGHADSLGPAGSALFVGLGNPACFAFRKADRPERSPTATAAEPCRAAAEPVEEAEFQFAATAAPTPVDVPEAAPAADSAPPLLDQACALANLGRHDEAIRLIDKQIRAKGPNAPAYHLMGIIFQAAGDRDRAERCFHKAVYLDPYHDEALLALALLADRRGDSAAASGYRRRAERALAAKEAS
jgi:chemotaxis protein methyltransferase WspC